MKTRRWNTPPPREPRARRRTTSALSDKVSAPVRPSGLPHPWPAIGEPFSAPAGQPRVLACLQSLPRPGRRARLPAEPRRRILISMNHYRAVPRRPLPGSPFNPPEAAATEPEHYVVSGKVTHDKYGLGTVIGVEEGVSVLIDFGSHKQLLRTPCTKLT